MKKKLIIGLLILTLIAVPLFATACEEEEPELVTLRIQSAYPRGDLSMEGLAYFADAADRFSNGTLKVEVFAEPEIVGMFDVPAAVVDGTLDMGMDNGGFWIGLGLGVGGVEFSLPYSYLIPEEDTFIDKANEIRRFFFEDGLIDILRAEYEKQGVYFLDIHSYGPVPFLVATEAGANAFQGTVDDIQGLTIRTDGLWMEWHNNMGMTGVDMSPPDAYTQLQTGGLDAHIWDVSAYIGMGFEEVAPYWVHGEENDHAIGHIVVNLDVWNSLSAAHQEALAKAAEEYWDKLLLDYDQAMKDVMAMVAAGTVIEVWMSAAVLAHHQEVGFALWDEVATWDTACADAVALVKAWRGVD